MIAVDNEPVIGIDLYDFVEMIRGKENTPVTLQVLREAGDKEGPAHASISACKSIPSQSTAERDCQDVEDRDNVHNVLLTKNDPQQIDGRSQPNGEGIGLRVLRITIQRGAVVVRDARLKSMIMTSAAGALGYLHLSSFYQDEESSSGEDMRQALQDLMAKEPLAGVILDLRGNPGGILQQAVEVCGLFMDSALICSVKEGESLYPFWNVSSQKIWDGPLVVLVDRTSASASEIVAQAFQDWGRAIIIGDDRTFGKGSFQMLSFGADNASSINRKGEYKISKGRYYTASGRSPQLVGVSADIEVCSPYRFMEVGEQYSAYPLSSECIPSYFDGGYPMPPERNEKSFSLKDEIKSFFSRAFFSQHSRFQKKQELALFLLPALRERSLKRMGCNESYQKYLASLQNNTPILSEAKANSEEKEEDFACQEAVHVLEDMMQIPSFGAAQGAIKQAA